MSNKARPGVRIILDRERTLVLNLNSMIVFEELTGKNLFDGTFSSASMSAKDMRSMLFACLQHEDDTLTPEQVGSMISVDNMADITSKLNEAFDVAVPRPRRKSARPLPKSSIG